MSQSVLDRTAGAPISWGVCEVPGWGIQLPVDRVLSEMSELGLRATELGSVGYLPTDSIELSSTLAAHRLELIGGFNALALADEARADEAMAQARTSAALLASAGATHFVTCPVSNPADWQRPELTVDQRSHLLTMLERVDEMCAQHGLVQVLHSHVDSLIETADEVQWILDNSDVRWVLDTGHLQIGGYDPVAFALQYSNRVHLVHLKDLRSPIAARLNAEELSLMEAVQEGLFVPLGQGDVDIATVIATLESQGFDGWYVIEQDAAITAGEPALGDGPIRDVRTSVAFIRSLDAELGAA
ncbi:MAG: sugar phosphate isomerase/epimerase family protein [Acidimicrobiales bacterium]